MALTLAHLKEVVRQELGRPPSLSSEEALVNEAGEAWVTGHTWTYLRARTIDIDLVEGTFMYRLPIGAQDTSDELARPNSVWDPIPIYAYPIFFREKERYLSEIGREYHPIASVYPSEQEGDTEERMYLEVWPSRITETVRLRYTEGWLPMNHDSDTAYLPKALEFPFREWVRRYAKGREMQPSSSVDTEWAAFFAGPVGLAAKTKDGMMAGRTPATATRAEQAYWGAKTNQRGFGSSNSWWDRIRWHYASDS